MSDTWWSEAPLADAGGGAPTRITVRPMQSAPDYAGAISKIESGGRYDLLGPTTRSGDRAFGKYQVMGANVPEWTKAALGQELTPQQFLSSPEAQDAVFQHRFGSYVDKYGPEGAAKAWFAGEGGMNNPNAKDQLGTTVSSYAQQFARNLGGSSAAQAATTPQQPAGADDWWQAAPLAGQPQAAPQAPVSQQGDIGRGTAALRGAQAGATFNMGDELAGGNAAAPVPNLSIMGIPVSSLYGLGRTALDSATGQPGEATQRYEQARNNVRQDLQTAQTQYPGTTLGGEIAGGAALPLGGMASGATLGGRALGGALAGGAYGALSGAGAGENPMDRLTQAGIGAGIGAAAGGVAAPLVEGAAKGLYAASGIPTSVRAFRGAINPEAEAARRVSGALARDTQAGSAGLSPAEFGAAQSAGMPVALADMGGETTRALARSAANTSPEGRSALEALAQDRFAGQSDRAASFIDNLFGGNVSSAADREAIKGAARGANSAAYGKAYQEGQSGLWSPELERLAGSDAVSGAMQRAIKSAKDEAIVSGQGAMNPRITFTADGRIQFNKGPTGVPTYPDLQYWDLVRRELSDAAQAARRTGHNTEAGRLGNFSKAMNAELDKLVPSYKDARQGAASFFGAQNAIEAGENFVRRNMSIAEAQSALAKMTPQDRELFRQGFASKLIDDLKNTRDGVNVLNKIGQSPEARNKLQLVLGPKGYNSLDALLTVEQTMDKLRRSLGNSTTARQIIEQGLAGGAGFEIGAMGTGNHLDPTNVLTGALAFALARGKLKIDGKVATRVAQMLTSNDPGVLAQGVRQVAGNRSIKEALRNIDLRSLTSVQRSLLGPPQHSMNAAANQEQP